jgi:hypothetical protein
LDFTLTTYKRLLNTLSFQGFSFSTIEGFISGQPGKVITLRHDVDASPENSIQFAKIEAEKEIRGTYYFRMVPQSYDETIIKEINSLGHEIGYHYEDFSLAVKRQKTKVEAKRRPRAKRGVKRQKYKNNEFSDLQDRKTAGPQDKRHIEIELALIALESFKENLAKLRELVPVKTICMHGSPMSKWDNRLLWKYYDFHDFGITGEPYFDVDFNSVLYLTDTGRRWDGGSVSIRDKASGVGRQVSGENHFKGWKVKPVKYRQEARDPAPSTLPTVPFPGFHSTSGIIRAANEGRLPDMIMMTFHPQRWTDKPLPWVKELVWQNVKNAGKYFLLKVNSE